MSDFEKTGDWEEVKRVIASISGNMQMARKTSLMRFGLKAEGIAKKHISAQDLPWKPLKAATIRRKSNAGYSTNILTETSTYFRSITSYVVGETAYAGVKRDVKEDDGTLVADIAKLHEYGSLSGKIPARELWLPTFEETVTWHIKSNQPAKIFVDIMKNQFPKLFGTKVRTKK